MMTALPLTAGRKLQLFRATDPLKDWWSLEELRFCALCEHLFVAREIKVLEDSEGRVHFQCPTHGCPAGFVDWQYPQLHL